VLDGVDIGAVDDFSTLDGDRWEATAVSVAGGNATIAGAPVWASGLYGRWAIEEGEGVVVRLAFQGDAEWDLGLSSGQFDSGTFRQFGFYSSPATLGRLTLETILGEESEVAEQFDPSVELEVGAAYDFLVAVAPGGEFAVAVWDPEERAPVSQKVAKGAEWAGQRWGFDIGANAGSVVVEQLAELTFTSIR
jgi:hypothetical protein